MNVIYNAYRKYRETLMIIRHEKRCRQYLHNSAAKRWIHSKTQKVWLIVTVAFNSPELIKQQFQSLKDRNQIMYLVADNSSSEAARDAIEQFCRMHEIGYISLPANPECKASDSHALALNWTVKNVVIDLLKNSTIKYWGILDHDIFNLSDNDIWFMKTADILKKSSVYGLKQVREEGWYLWPGFVFFEREWTIQNRKRIDFGVTSWGDTGSKMCKLYAHLQADGIFAEQLKECIDNSVKADPQENEYEIFDQEWLHTIGGSGWAGNDAVGKNRKIFEQYGKKIYKKS